MTDPAVPSTSSPDSATGSGADVSWLKYRRVARFLTRLQKRCACALTVDRDAASGGMRIAADERSVRALDRQLAWLSAGRFARGLAIGLVCGIIAAYLVIPSLGAYLFSSRAGILPPEYDALIRTKNVNEQAVQILEHTFPSRTKGAFSRRRVCFEAQINDSSSIRLTYSTQRKGLVTRVGQRVGSRVAGDLVQGQLAKTGVDSVVGRITGGEGRIAEGLGDAVSRSASMQVEKEFRGDPVLTVSTLVDGVETEFVNYYEYEGVFHKDFTSRDADSTDIESGDHTRVKRERRAPTAADQQTYLALVKEFLARYRAGEYSE